MRPLAVADRCARDAQAIVDRVARRPSGRALLRGERLPRACIYTAGDDSFLASLIDLAGGEPIIGDATGVIQLEDLVDGRSAS